MIIQLDPRTRIKGTAHSWELQRQRNHKGAKRWVPYKWFTSFGSALQEPVHREIRVHPAHGLAEAIGAVSGLVQKYEELIPGEFRFTNRVNQPDS